MLRNFEAKNRSERRYVHPEAIERQVRAQVQRDHPDLTPAEVEKRVARRVRHGMRPH
jgi:hypothetical protein